MHYIKLIEDRMRENGDQPAIYWQGKTLSYTQFTNLIDTCGRTLEEHNIGQGDICALIGDFSPVSCAMTFALMRKQTIFAPLTDEVQGEMDKFLDIAAVKHIICVDQKDELTFDIRTPGPTPDLIETFKSTGHPGLVVFSSGSTGEPKGILQDCERVMKKFVTPRPGWRTVLFLMFDHFGGFNTLMGVFGYGGLAVCVPSRRPDAVCAAIGETQATLLPSTPTFLNLLLVSGSYKQHDLSSVKLITYGTEVMNDATLQKIKSAFPNARLKQTYGLSELGVLRSKSESDKSLWMKIGGDGFEVKVVDDILWIRSEANMVGYLNAEQPFDAEGWMCTGDEVEVKEGLYRIKGRKSEMINVGGQKVFPVEVEEVLMLDKNVSEVTVYGLENKLMGQMPVARVSLINDENEKEAISRLRRQCVEHLAKYKIPQRFIITKQDDQVSGRFKKIRNLKD